MPGRQSALTAHGGKDFFSALKAAMRERGATVKSVFREYDKNNDGQLSLDEYTAMFMDLVPGCTKADVDFFVAMLDTGGPRAPTPGSRAALRKGAGNRKLEFQELHAAVMVCYQYGEAVRNHAPAARLAWGRLAEAMKKAGARQTFDLFDSDKSGALDLVETVHMMRALVPDLSLSEMRYILANLRDVDANGDGLITYEELLQRFNLAEPEPEPEPEPAPPPPPPPPVPSPPPPTRRRHRKGPVVTIVSSAPPTAFATSWPVADGGLDASCSVSSPGKRPPSVAPNADGVSSVTLMPPPTPGAQTPVGSDARKQLTIRIPRGYGVRRIVATGRATVCDIFADVHPTARADETGVYVCSVAADVASAEGPADLFAQRGGMAAPPPSPSRIVWERNVPEPVRQLVLDIGGASAPSIDGLELVVEPLPPPQLYARFDRAAHALSLAESASGPSGGGSAQHRAHLARLATRLEVVAGALGL